MGKRGRFRGKNRDLGSGKNPPLPVFFPFFLFVFVSRFQPQPGTKNGVSYHTQKKNQGKLALVVPCSCSRFWTPRGGGVFYGGQVQNTEGGIGIGIWGVCRRGGERDFKLKSESESGVCGEVIAVCGVLQNPPPPSSPAISSIPTPPHTPHHPTIPACVPTPSPLRPSFPFRSSPQHFSGPHHDPHFLSLQFGRVCSPAPPFFSKSFVSRGGGPRNSVWDMERICRHIGGWIPDTRSWYTDAGTITPPGGK